MTYRAAGAREILKTTKLYSDGKTQVPKEVINRLKLKKGSPIVWVEENNRIFIESSTSS